MGRAIVFYDYALAHSLRMCKVEGMDPTETPKCLWCSGPLIAGLNTDFCSSVCEDKHREVCFERDLFADFNRDASYLQHVVEAP